LTMNTHLASVANPLTMAWFLGNETLSFYLLFRGCHSRELRTFVTPVFSIAIAADFFFSDL